MYQLYHNISAFLHKIETKSGDWHENIKLVSNQSVLILTLNEKNRRKYCKQNSVVNQDALFSSFQPIVWEMSRWLVSLKEKKISNELCDCKETWMQLETKVLLFFEEKKNIAVRRGWFLLSVPIKIFLLISAPGFKLKSIEKRNSNTQSKVLKFQKLKNTKSKSQRQQICCGLKWNWKKTSKLFHAIGIFCKKRL